MPLFRPYRPLVPFFRDYVCSVGALLVTLGILSSASHCTPAQRQIARDVISVTQMACILAHQADPEADVAKACALAEPLLEPIRDVLAQARKSAASAKVQAARCGDAGL